MRMVTGSLAVAALVAAAPAAADVKAGVDAWGRGDRPRAVAEWRPLAVQGDADAQFNLGQAYKLGRGVPTDPAQALAWFKRAADQGHLQAEDNYGIGLFQANREAEALPYLERSAARGEPRAQLVLGTMLFNGDGVRADYPRAYALMTRASQAGLPSASQSLAQMDGFITLRRSRAGHPAGPAVRRPGAGRPRARLPQSHDRTPPGTAGRRAHAASGCGVAPRCPPPRRLTPRSGGGDWRRQARAARRLPRPRQRGGAVEPRPRTGRRSACLYRGPRCHPAPGDRLRRPCRRTARLRRLGHYLRRRRSLTTIRATRRTASRRTPPRRPARPRAA